MLLQLLVYSYVEIFFKKERGKKDPSLYSV
jgi:hypothetical protein